VPLGGGCRQGPPSTHLEAAVLRGSPRHDQPGRLQVLAGKWIVLRTPNAPPQSEFLNLGGHLGLLQMSATRVAQAAVHRSYSFILKAPTAYTATAWT